MGANVARAGADETPNPPSKASYKTVQGLVGVSKEGIFASPAVRGTNTTKMNLVQIPPVVGVGACDGERATGTSRVNGMDEGARGSAMPVLLRRLERQAVTLPPIVTRRTGLGSNQAAPRISVPLQKSALSKTAGYPEANTLSLLLPHSSCCASTKAQKSRSCEAHQCQIGLENYGSTCFCNAVLQLLYYCSALRSYLLSLHHRRLKNWRHSTEKDSCSILRLVADFFAKMHRLNTSGMQQKSLLGPSELLSHVRRLSPSFETSRQHDAHEFSMFLLNRIVEDEARILPYLGASCDDVVGCVSQELTRRTPPLANLSCDEVRGSSDSSTTISTSQTCGCSSFESQVEPLVGSLSDYSRSCSSLTVKSIVGGQFIALTVCCECEHVSVMREEFMDLSLDVAQGTSLRHCMERFGTVEVLDGDNKLQCDHCKKQVVAQRAIRIHRLPQHALFLHLKRFQYNGKTGQMVKRNDHVVLPSEMDVFEHDLVEEEEGAGGDDVPKVWLGHPLSGCSATPLVEDHIGGGGARRTSLDSGSSTTSGSPRTLLQKLTRMKSRKIRFVLRGFVPHRGSGPDAGHYYACVRFGNSWKRFDDKKVSRMTEREVQRCWGVPTITVSTVTSTAYLLLYERAK
ncbi:putative Ubiquitin carboxyl terminal hydrolase [Trypanosoma vivax]|uniref:Ubiquitin carboxyl-terminal hydrolase n=1 Tax=Trypanosoma vivax (strain Y486) TaxID=1055687 RepID=G0U5L9_TRYVY|nr:putative Ubiquitin carboxyl terminal hydrolase [Trypanosoma vivax]CCC51170.1 putative ubiquitin hydrolase [Trypanosoma vivax Y486]